MTLQDVVDGVEAVRKYAECGDFERAHSDEDDLYAAILAHIAATDAGEIGEIARVAISTHDIEFPRWCA